MTSACADSLGASRNTNLHLVKEQRKELQNYCHDLLERQVSCLGVAMHVCCGRMEANKTKRMHAFLDRLHVAHLKIDAPRF